MVLLVCAGFWPHSTSPLPLYTPPSYTPPFVQASGHILLRPARHGPLFISCCPVYRVRLLLAPILLSGGVHAFPPTTRSLSISRLFDQRVKAIMVRVCMRRVHHMTCNYQGRCAEDGVFLWLIGHVGYLLLPAW